MACVQHKICLCGLKYFLLCPICLLTPPPIPPSHTHTHKHMRVCANTTTTTTTTSSQARYEVYIFQWFSFCNVAILIRNNLCFFHFHLTSEFFSVKVIDILGLSQWFVQRLSVI